MSIRIELSEIIPSWLEYDPEYRKELCRIESNDARQVLQWGKGVTPTAEKAKHLLAAIAAINARVEGQKVATALLEELADTLQEVCFDLEEEAHE